MEKISGIYKITNNINHKSYIGSSVDIYTRWREHKRRSKNKTEWTSDIYESPLYRSFRKNGLENFTFEIIERVEENRLLERERYWYNYYQPEYNRMYPERNPSYKGAKHTNESRRKISENNCKYWKGKKLPKEMIQAIVSGNIKKRKQVVMINKETSQEIMRFDGICNALRYLNKNPNSTSQITLCCKGVISEAYGYVWKYLS